MRRFFLIWILVTLPIGVSVADEYQCELRPLKYMTPRIHGCQFVSELVPPRFYADFKGTRDGQPYREIQEFPNGSCWEIGSTASPTVFETLKSELEKLKSTAPDEIRVFVIDTEKDPPLRKLRVKKSNSSTQNMDISDFRGKYQFIEEGGVLKSIRGTLDNGLRLRLILAGPDTSKLVMTGGFGRIVSEGSCVRRY